MITRFTRGLKKLKYLSSIYVKYSSRIMETNITKPGDDDVVVAPAAQLTKLQTEDTGKIFEKAICDAYGIPFDGPFQYSQAEVDKLTPRLKRLVTDNLFPLCVHTASKGARYDFTAVADSGIHLSAKSNKKKGGKVAPQVVGQATPQKFWEEVCICSSVAIAEPAIAEPAIAADPTEPATLKKYIQENITTIMPMLWRYTFDSPIVYYVRDTNEIRFIAPAGGDDEPDWSAFQYTWSRSYDKWTNSTSLRVIAPGDVKEETIMEFQFHTKSRQNMAVRWAIDKVLQVFAGHFKVDVL